MVRTQNTQPQPGRTETVIELFCPVDLIVSTRRTVHYEPGIQSMPSDLAILLCRLRSAVPYRPAPAQRAQ